MAVADVRAQWQIPVVNLVAFTEPQRFLRSSSKLGCWLTALSGPMLTLSRPQKKTYPTLKSVYRIFCETILVPVLGKEI